MFTVEQRDALSEHVLGLAREDERVVALEPGSLRAALASCIVALIHEGEEARLPHARVIAERLDELR